MKKLLFLLFPIFSYGQASFNVMASDFQTVGIGVVAGQSFVTGRLYIWFVGVSNAGGSPATITLTGTGQTWTQVATTLNNSTNRRIYAFRFAPGSNNTNQTDFNITGVQDGMFHFLVEVTNVITTGTNGADGVVQSTTSSANGADPSLTLSALGGRNSVISSFINERNPFTGTPESGWTESDGGYATPDTGGYLMYRVNTTDNTPTVTATSSNWGGIAIEVRTSGRRAVIVN